jgi:hypothetical protein
MRVKTRFQWDNRTPVLIPDTDTWAGCFTYTRSGAMPHCHYPPQEGYSLNTWDPKYDRDQDPRMPKREMTFEFFLVERNTNRRV